MLGPQGVATFARKGAINSGGITQHFDWILKNCGMHTIVVSKILCDLLR